RERGVFGGGDLLGGPLRGARLLRADGRDDPKAASMAHERVRSRRPEGVGRARARTPPRSRAGPGLMPPLLELRDVTRHFGGVVALDDVTFSVQPGEIAGLIGPNGAGKTTAFNVITRLHRPESGGIPFEGEGLVRTPPHKVVRRGIAGTFQNVELFPTMTVLENVLVGAHARRHARARAREVLEYVEIDRLAEYPAAGLPYGTQKRIELAPALVSQPRVLLLDEPAGGLSHEEVERLGSFITATRD